MIIAWLFGVTFGTILTIGAQDAINKPRCVIGADQKCVVIGERK